MQVIRHKDVRKDREVLFAAGSQNLILEACHNVGGRERAPARFDPARNEIGVPTSVVECL